MKCNACRSTELEPRTQAVATTCAHLFCIACAQKIFESDCVCPVCEEVVSKSTVKLVSVLQGEGAFQLALCGQTPETALNSAAASIQFFVQQTELTAQLCKQQHEAKIAKVQDACKRKLQEVHNAYTAAKRKYQDAMQERNQLVADNQELQQKYAQKAAQARKAADLYQKAQQEIDRLHGGGGGRRSTSEAGNLALGSGLNVVTPANLGLPRGRPGNGRVVTTVHSKQVFLAPGQQGFSPNLSNGALRGLFHDSGMRQELPAPQQSGSEGLGMGGLGGLSVLHDTRGRGTGQHPLRQLLSGNLGQARGSGGYHKRNFLGGASPKNLASL